jgi:hypothetical protein
MNAAASQQISAQSRSSRMHSAIIFTSGSSRQAFAQCSHSWAQRTQASMQDRYCSRAIVDLRFGRKGVKTGDYFNPWDVLDSMIEVIHP